MNKPYRLRLPGPTTVPERVRNALAMPIFNHRGPEFGAIVKEIESHLQGIIGTTNAVLLFAASGTGMMEASLANTMGPGDKALFVANGQFADRFAAVSAGLGLHADILDVPWGEVYRLRYSGRDLPASVGPGSLGSAGSALIGRFASSR